MDRKLEAGIPVRKSRPWSQWDNEDLGRERGGGVAPTIETRGWTQKCGKESKGEVLPNQKTRRNFTIIQMLGLNPWRPQFIAAVKRLIKPSLVKERFWWSVLTTTDLKVYGYQVKKYYTGFKIRKTRKGLRGRIEGTRRNNNREIREIGAGKSWTSFVLLRTIYYSREEDRKEGEKTSWTQVDRFENYHCGVKRQRQSLENTSVPGLWVTWRMSHGLGFTGK